MASYTLHLRQARHNERLIRHLDINTTTYHDWVVTITFYAALHYVEAAFANIPSIMHAHLHRRLNESVHNTIVRLAQTQFGLVVYQSYRNLLDASFVARYLYSRATGLVRRGYRYYSRQDVLNFYHIDLGNIKRILGF